MLVIQLSSLLADIPADLASRAIAGSPLCPTRGCSRYRGFRHAVRPGVSRRQADTAKALVLRGEKGLEGAKHGFPASFQYRSFDAKLDKDVSALDDGRAFNRNQTAIPHCVARVENEIQKRVLQTQAIALHSRQVGSDADLEMDFRLPYAPDERRDFGQTGTCARLFAEMLTDRLRLYFRVPTSRPPSLRQIFGSLCPEDVMSTGFCVRLDQGRGSCMPRCTSCQSPGNEIRCGRCG